jgi:hypothetical protein
MLLDKACKKNIALQSFAFNITSGSLVNLNSISTANII